MPTKEQEALKIWHFMNQNATTPPTKAELQLALKLVGEIDIAMADYKQRLEKLRRTDVINP